MFKADNFDYPTDIRSKAYVKLYFLPGKGRRACIVATKFCTRHNI